MPPLGATFVPGGHDDYLMPEVFAPAPQRVMPEVPQNMQNDLQRMELEARSVERRDTSQSVSSPPPHPPPPPTDTPNYPRHPRGQEFVDYRNDIYARTAAAAQYTDNLPVPSTFAPFRADDSDAATMDAPSFSPFPKVKGENIPPSASESEEILWNARTMVLHSNNVPMQIVWARDTLMYVEVAAEDAARERKRSGIGRDGDRPPTPKVEHELRLDAVNIVDFLCKQGHPEATFMQGKWHEFGKFGYRESKKDAYTCYKKAADNGFGRAEYRMGMLYENTNDIEKAIQHYKIGAENLNDSASNYRLGMLHLMGQHGFRKDFVRGIELINKAADTADEDAPQGAYVYGMLIARELPDIEVPEGVLPYELVLARQYIAKAAYLGFAKAQLKMGQAYELSQLGCEFNPSYSLHYYGLAARQGQPEAALGVSRWFLFGSQDGAFSKNESLAFRYAQDAALSGLATAEFAMGYYHEVGIHVSIDLREARRWYELAADHGNKDAMGRIEGLNQSKSLTKEDHETTTLTRIKSQHGSMRGKRPERFAGRQNDVMPPVVEDHAPPIPGKIPTPVVSPRQPPSVNQGYGLDYPDTARQNSMPAPNLALRPKSAAPYPEDDRPPPLNFGRSQSAAPYPVDDGPPGSRPQGPALSPHYNPSFRPSAGPQADRPMSAFGVRPGSPHSGAGGGLALQPQDMRAGRIPSSQSAGSGWEHQLPAGYRQPSPGRHDVYRKPSPAQTTPYPGGDPGVMAGPTSGAPVGDPTRNRLQKTNPNAKPQPLPQGRPSSQYPAGTPYGAPSSPAAIGTQPGRDYGPRASSMRPASDNYGYSAAPANTSGRLPSGSAAGRPERLDSHLPSAAMGARVPVGGSGLPPRPRPGQLDSAGGRASVPPAQQTIQQKPTMPPAVAPRPLPTSSSLNDLPGPGYGATPTSRPTAKPANAATSGSASKPAGPATFEEMGIPQGKNDSDCVLM